MIIVQASGQTCNQFWIYSNYIADCIEFKQRNAIWVPDISIKDYDNFKNSEYLSFPLYSKPLIKILGYKRYFRIMSMLFANKYSLKFFKLLFNLIPGFSFIIPDVEVKKSSFKAKHINQLKKIFKPNEDILNCVEDLFKSKRNVDTLIVGIHIRYGDYRTFQNGKYFYSLDEYRIFMKNIESLYKDKKIVFFIASNELLDLSFFKDFQYFQISESSSTKDMVGLSKCDYICGPPSTFSAWASLYNHVPLYFIEEISNAITQDSFIHIEDIWF